VYLSPQKVHHISRFVELPDMGTSSKFPPLLVVNVQVHTSLKFAKEEYLYLALSLSRIPK
jgi:hypothetical protein